MPGGDRTGPMGMGPMTGRGAGYCAGYNLPGYANPVLGRGFGRGRGWFGRGRGRGWTGRYGYGPGFGFGWVNPDYSEAGSNLEEKEILDAQARQLQAQLDELHKRIEILEKERRSE